MRGMLRRPGSLLPACGNYRGYRQGMLLFEVDPSLNLTCLFATNPDDFSGDPFAGSTQEVQVYLIRHTSSSGSFSAVSTPIFAGKKLFFSIFEIYKMCIVLHLSNLSKLAKMYEMCLIILKCLMIF